MVIENNFSDGKKAIKGGNQACINENQMATDEWLHCHRSLTSSTGYLFVLFVCLHMCAGITALFLQSSSSEVCCQ